MSQFSNLFDSHENLGHDSVMRARPNILWIVTTQWRGQAAGYAGDPNARTPELDRLAAQSVDFTQAVTPHPFGPFARAALLTGVPSPQNGIADYFDPLPITAPTIAHRLNGLGYATAFFGKWHLGRRDPAAAPVGEAHAKTPVPPAARGGFAFWEGFESGFQLNDPWLQGSRLPEPQRFPGYQADVLADRAGPWLAASNRPWFCQVSLEPPHPPYHAPASGVPSRDPQAIVLAPNVPRGGSTETQARRELSGYYAHLEATDRAIGRLLAAVATADPIVVVTSVHGDMHGAHGLFRKGWPHEESVRVPLLVRTPPAFDLLPARTKSDAAVSLLDLPAWTQRWASGAPLGPLPVAARISMPSVVRLPQQCDRVWRGVRSPRRKLVLNADGTPWLFFNLEQDPGEMTNLAEEAASAAEIEELKGQVV